MDIHSTHEIPFDPNHLKIPISLKFGPAGTVHAFSERTWPESELRSLFSKIELFLDFKGYHYKFKHFPTERELYRAWVQDVMEDQHFERISFEDTSTEQWDYKPEMEIDSVPVFITASGKKYHLENCSHLKKTIRVVKLHLLNKSYTPCSRCLRPKTKNINNAWICILVIFGLLLILIPFLINLS